MSEQRRDDKSRRDRKRQRPSGEDEAMDSPTDEPPKKQSRLSSQSSTRAQCPTDPSPEQQPQYLETSDLDAIRRERRKLAYRTLNVDLPSIIARLKEIDRRSKAAADEEKGGSAGQQGVTGPCSGPKKRKLVTKLKKLLDDATDLLRRQHELLKADDSSYEKELKSSADKLQRLAAEATRLTELHREIQHANDASEEESQKRDLDQVRLIINHPLFEAGQPSPPPQQGDAPNEAPLLDTADLIGAVTDEMRKMLQCSYSLRQWISLNEPPVLVATNHELGVREKGLAIIASLVKFSELSLASCQEYVVTRTTLTVNIVKEPLSFDRMRALDSYDSVMGIVWRHYATELANHCGLLMDFVNKHIPVLEESMRPESAVDSLYS